MKFTLVATWGVIGFLVFVPRAFAVESDVDRLLDLLIKKGVVTQEEAAEFRADLAVKKQEEKEKQKEFALIAGKPIKISGFTQVRYRQDRSINDTADIRRARLDIKGDVTERFDYRTQIEFGGTSGPFLLDATAGYKVTPSLKLTAGQFKIPFSQENLSSDEKSDTINRSQVVEALVARSTDVIGNQNGRDIGAQASGNAFPNKDSYWVDYAIGVFNGSGMNKGDLNEQKDVVGRVVLHPLKELSVGSSYYFGRETLSSSPAHRDDRDRVGAEFAYLHDPISFKGEYIQGNDGATSKEGEYLQGGYFLIPEKLQGVLKWDRFDPDTELGKNETTIYTLGGNWYFNKWASLQVDYEFKDERGKEIDNNALTGQLTLQF